MADVFCGPPPSLLMNQVEIIESRFFAGVELKEQRFRGKFVSTCNSIVAGIGNFS